MGWLRNIFFPRDVECKQRTMILEGRLMVKINGLLVICPMHGVFRSREEVVAHIWRSMAEGITPYTDTGEVSRLIDSVTIKGEDDA